MSECPNLAGCPIFNKFKNEGAANFWISSYCKGRFQRCKRKELREQGQQVPPNMLPNGNLMDALK